MSDDYIFDFDEADSARWAHALAAATSRVTKARVHLVHVLEWSPHSYLTQDELVARLRRREAEPTRSKYRGSGCG
ncbi:MAG: hypothetical protein ABJ360_03310 [Roseobacter sp.]